MLFSYKISLPQKIIQMSVKIFCIALVVILTSVSCTQEVAVITDWKAEKIALDSTTEAYADADYLAYLQPIKQKLDAELNVIIGQAAEPMKVGLPESLLSNFVADVFRKAGSDYLKSPVDIAIVNMGSMRTEITDGDVTVRKIFELMPFENELVIVWLKGDKLLELLHLFASKGGEGVSGLKMTISNGRATNVTLNGNALDMNRVYSIATNDYLADGNGGNVQLTMSEKREDSGLKIRDILLQHVKDETNKGNKIKSKLDGRISHAHN